MQGKARLEGQKVRSVGTAQVNQPPLLPPLRQHFQLVTEYRPVPEVIPARGYLIKYIYYYLTPLIPLSFKGERGEFLKEEAKPP